MVRRTDGQTDELLLGWVVCLSAGGGKPGVMGESRNIGKSLIGNYTIIVITIIPVSALWLDGNYN